ncbi:MAG: hypothetical protein JNM66_16760 [Bryobacterales bacterium]|nr:hypothetical protein [Bryobacterales bacterium]
MALAAAAPPRKLFYDEPFGRKEITAMVIIFAGVLIVKARTALGPAVLRLMGRGSAGSSAG